MERLAPHARTCLERAAVRALEQHAEELALEHLLVAILEDEDAAATRAVLHAFADPATLAEEVLALSPGILVVGSGRSLPFSPMGVRALENARRRAQAEGEEHVDPDHVLDAAVLLLAFELRAALVAAGLEEPAAEVSGIGTAWPGERSFFQRFTSDARRSLGAACRHAAAFERRAISPAHLVLGALDVSNPRGVARGLTPSRARLVLSARDADATGVPDRPIRLAPELGDTLASLSSRADTLALLSHVLAHGAPELRQLFARQKVTRALLDQAQGIFTDP